MRRLDELRGLGFTRFPLKYRNSCCICGKNLPEGEYAYGTKIGTKWSFLCPKCHGELTSEVVESVPIPEDLAEELFGGPESAGAVSDGESFLTDDFLESLNCDLDESGFKSDPAKVEPVAMDKTVMQLISENARWRVER